MNSENYFNITSNDQCEELNVYAGNQYIRISVTQEKALDSYNHDIECYISLSHEQVKQLIDFLNAQIDKTKG